MKPCEETFQFSSLDKEKKSNSVFKNTNTTELLIKIHKHMKMPKIIYNSYLKQAEKPYTSKC